MDGIRKENMVCPLWLVTAKSPRVIISIPISILQPFGVPSRALIFIILAPLGRYIFIKYTFVGVALLDGVLINPFDMALRFSREATSGVIRELVAPVSHIAVISVFKSGFIVDSTRTVVGKLRERPLQHSV